MQRTALIKLWKTLERREHAPLRAFLQSPFFNRRADVLALFELLATTPDDALDQLEKPGVFARLFPGQPYDNRALNYVLSFLTGQIEQFLAWQEFVETEGWRDLFLSRSLRRRGLDARFESEVAQLEARHTAQPLRNAGYYLFRYQLEHEKFAHRLLRAREAPLELSAATDALNRFFVLENLRWAATALSVEARYGVAHALPFAAPALDYAAALDPDTAPEIELQRLGYLVLSDIENEENFWRLKQLIQAHGERFSATEMRDLYLLAINFCLRRHNRGERPAYTREALALYRAALDQGLLLDHGTLPKYAYNNMVRLACLADERDWAKTFLETYRQALPIAERENVYCYNLAIYHYLGGEYRQVPALLQTFDFSDRDSQLNARQMLARAYFELEEWTALASLLDSFYVYIRRRADIGYLRETYLNFIKYVRKLLKPGATHGRRAERLAERIRHERYLAEREWLLGKVSPNRKA